MNVRDRIRELRRVPARELRPNPRNWRTHPPAQQDTLRGVLAEIGYADALLARMLPDGSLELIDGHLRAETTPDVEVPVLVLDLTEAEADKLLAVLDPLAGMAATDRDALAGLIAHVETESAAVRALLDRLVIDPEPPPLESNGELPDEVHVPEAFQVVVECRDEDQQREVYERMKEEGYRCKLLTL
jgi:hypothetical protein